MYETHNYRTGQGNEIQMHVQSSYKPCTECLGNSKSLTLLSSSWLKSTKYLATSEAVGGGFHLGLLSLSTINARTPSLKSPFARAVRTPIRYSRFKHSANDSCLPRFKPSIVTSIDVRDLPFNIFNCCAAHSLSFSSLPFCCCFF